MRAGVVTVVTLSVLATAGLAPPTAEATTLQAKALTVAASKQGAPYRYGAAGPDSFDCSGLTLFAYHQAGAQLPRTAQAQYDNTTHIPSSDRLPGDLVFFHDGRRVYHVAIYAGNNQVWHAPHPGADVRLEHIWTDAVWYGRL
ncbi:C40 family peptidase [Streptacidiphilus sp. EB103A]|uniref:C40 family peptidase n=1 Tax=Streptacidiphilus sp. EB103A TaxID=3156275 RepID=UPI003511338A